MKENKTDVFMWACSEIRESVDQGMYGTITLTMQNGVVGNLKREIVSKPPVDNMTKRQ